LLFGRKWDIIDEEQMNTKKRAAIGVATLLNKYESFWNLAIPNSFRHTEHALSRISL